MLGHEAVPDEAVDLGQRDPGLGAVGVEQAQLDPLGDLAEHREVGARAVVGRAQRIRLTRPHFTGGSGSGGMGAVMGARASGLVMAHLIPD